MKLIILVCCLLCSCVEFRLSKGEVRDKYFGNANTKTYLDPKLGPQTKIYFANAGNIRPYIGGEILHKQELLFGVGMIEYLSEHASLEIGVRDSIYSTTRPLNGEREVSYDSWDGYNPMFFVGGVIKW